MRPLLALSLALAPLVLGAADTPAPAVPAATNPAAPAATPASDAYWRAMKLLRDGKPADWPQVRALLKQATDAEFPAALNFVALCHLNKQYGYSKDASRAANFLRLSAEQGNASARLLLGRCYLFGTGVRRDRAQAATWLNAVLAPEADFSVPQPPADYVPTAKSAASLPGTLSGEMPVDPADQLRASAHVFLGQICTADKKPGEAQDHFVKAATQGANHSAGIYDAAIMAAVNYAFGQGVPRDMKKADEMLALSKTLARRNVLLVTHNMVEQKLVDDFAQADVEEGATAETDKIETRLQFAIAGSLADPKSKTYDPKEAAKWYELAAEKGEAWAMLSLAFIHHEGHLGQPDPVKAFEWFKKAAEKGNHNLGWADLSICYERGLGTPADHAKAAEIWQKRRDNSIVCYLGSIGQCPASLLTYEQELELTRIWAEKKEDAHAQYLLAMRYINGWGVEQNRKSALRWLQKAARSNHGQALCQEGLLYEYDWENLGCQNRREGFQKAFKCYEQAAAAGDAYGRANLANFYSSGWGCTQDINKTIELYKECLRAKPDFDRALNNLGSAYEQLCLQATKSHQLEKAAQYKTAMFDYYRKAEQLGFAYATYNLGTLAYEGTLQPKDLQAAYTYFESAAARGYPAAIVHFQLGQMLENGEGVPISLREAAYHYRLAALAGSRVALIRLCKFYTNKPGFTRDWDRALYWLAMLARQGEQRAFIDLGYALIQKGAYEEALKLHKQMLESSDPWFQGYANERLSLIYRDGLGVKPDPRKARRFHDKACELGNSDALFARYEELLKAGQPKEALPLLDKAAKAGLPEAIAAIGRRFLRGDGFPQNVKLGLQCLRNAADAGDPNAIATLVQATIDRIPGAPSADSAWKYVQTAEECSYAEAAALREKLTALQPTPNSATPAETSAARPL